jgi:hypothetical protein
MRRADDRFFLDNAATSVEGSSVPAGFICAARFGTGHTGDVVDAPDCSVFSSWFEASYFF